MTEGKYSNVGHRGPVYKGLGAMNPCDNLHILQSNAAVLMGGVYANLVGSSVGLKIFNLLVSSSSSSRAGVILLWCVASLYRYLMLKLVISALTVGICRSVCRSVFGTYRGALTIVLKEFK
jgi:hypothetical protein